MKKLALILKEGKIVVMPTDTIYGICGSALDKKAVERIYKLRKRNLKKPMIVLISDIKDLKKFEIKLSEQDKEILEKIWPAKISVILECKNKKFEYLHRRTKSIAFRMPKDRLLQKVLSISGPLVAPSANFEGEKPAETISEAKRYFKDRITYFDGGVIIDKPSTLIKIKNGKIEIVREGAELSKITELNNPPIFLKMREGLI